MSRSTSVARTALAAAAAAALLLIAGAQGAHAYVFGSNWKFADVNVPAGDFAPAYPGDQAVWSGACDLTNGSAAIGTAPSVRAHCIDTGAYGNSYDPSQPFRVWTDPARAPSWRLTPVTQAGAHPDASVSFFFPRSHGETGGRPEANVKNIIVKLPRGVVGNPEAVSKCSAIDAQAIPPLCSPDAQVGVATIALWDSFRTQVIFGIEARDTVTAEFTIANAVGLFNIPITARGRTNGDYGVDTLTLLIPSYIPLLGTTATFWGVPWATSHDRYRIDNGSYYEKSHDIPISGVAPVDSRPYQPEWGPIRPFFINPTECSGSSLELHIEADTWQSPVGFGGSYAKASSVYDPITGCEKLEFDPQLTMRPTAAVSDSASGLEVNLSIPQNNDPPAEAFGNPNLPNDPSDANGAPAFWKTDAGLATAHLKDTTIELPAGTSFNPAAANGLEGCTTEQIGLAATTPNVTFDNEPVRCPESSKLGTLQINSPLLPDPLFGDVYAAPQHDNPFPGSLTAIYLVSQDEERGLSVKLPGKIDLDPRTGQIATTFVDNPQLPFEDFILRLKTGPRAPLNTPPVCGQFRNAATMTPWSFPGSGPAAQLQDPFDIAAMPSGLGCVTEPEDRVFGPGFRGGSTDTQAGAQTQFVAEVTRADGHQELATLSFDMPPGLLANLSDIPYCPEAAIASIAGRTGLAETNGPSCPESSRIGSVDTLAGAGPLPLPTSGRLYLAGPYNPDGAGPQARAPISVVGVVPAIAGGTPGKPAFDLGNVVVRSAAQLDPVTAKVTVASTPLPYIVGGVPLRVRRIVVRIDKPGFMLNPTNCSEMTLGATLGGAADPLDPADDSSVSLSNRFQVGGCEKLGFKPKLALRLKGGTKRGANPALSAVLTPRSGDANIARASVTMPRSAFLAQDNMKNICTRVQYAANQCPASSVYGVATAYSPLLNEPLTGPVYLRSSDNKLPDMVASLRGQIDVELVGRIDTFKRRIRSTFDVVPDAPVTKFVLKMRGGRRSLIENSTNLCATSSRALVNFTAQNGRALRVKPKVTASCKKGAKRKSGKRARKRR